MAEQNPLAETIGGKLRRARQSLNLSLQQVAERVNLSSATLSRIETNKQSLDLDLFLSLTESLELDPGDFFPREGNGDAHLPQTLLRLDARERTRLWRELAASTRAQKSSSGYLRRTQIRAMADDIEELLAQFEFMRQEIESLRRRLKNC